MLSSKIKQKNGLSAAITYVFGNENMRRHNEIVHHNRSERRNVVRLQSRSEPPAFLAVFRQLEADEGVLFSGQNAYRSEPAT